MNPIFQQLIIDTVKRGKTNPKNISKYKKSKQLYSFKATVFHYTKVSFLLTLGIVSAGFGLEGFLLPNSFIDGGVTGISLLTAELTEYPLQILIILINIPFIILGYTQIGKSFAIRSILAISGLALAITFIHYPVITSDKLLVAVFGGFFLGMGIGFAMRGGGVLDGTEVLAIFLSKKSGATIGDIILILNIVIFSVAAYVLSIETALYSILTYLAASKTVDFVIEGVEEYTGVTIVSSYSAEIRVMITEKLGRGVTMYMGKRGYGRHGGNHHNPVEIVYTVITRLEIAKLQNEVEKIDSSAFIVMNTVNYTKGGMVKKRPLH
ncbi:MAG: YitT family protein [Bacteroidetes bacterium]|nr:YitT family protein [Bacteroidota bacterium]